MPWQDHARTTGTSLKEHARTTGTALKNWFVAQSQDALAVGAMWFLGLWIAGIPWPWLWAIIGAICQFIPHIGAIIAVTGPFVTGLFQQDRMEAIYVLIVYAVIVVVDGLFLQPYFMKRTVKVPIWASLIVPIICGIIIPFWGVLLAPPALAVFYAYKRKKEAEKLALANQVPPPPPPPLSS